MENKTDKKISSLVLDLENIIMDIEGFKGMLLLLAVSLGWFSAVGPSVTSIQISSVFTVSYFWVLGLKYEKESPEIGYFPLYSGTIV